jgi:hypothetical protein
MLDRRLYKIEHFNSFRLTANSERARGVIDCAYNIGTPAGA